MADDYPMQWVVDETRLYFGGWRAKQTRLHINPHYREMDEKYGMDYWHGLYSSGILGDMDGVHVGIDGYPEYDLSIADEIEQFAIERIEIAVQQRKEVFTIR